MGALLIASVVGVSVFSATSNGAYNIAATSSDSTIVYVEYRLPSDISDPSVNKLQSTDDLETNVLYKISLDGTLLTSEAFSEVEMVASDLNGSKTPYIVHYTDTEENFTITYFTVKMAKYYDPTLTYDFSFNGESFTTLFGKDGVIDKAVSTYAGTDNITTSVKNVEGSVGTPSMASLWLGLGIGLLADLIYMMLRYRPSRGLAAGLTASASSLIVCGFFALTRLPVTPLVSLGAVAIGFLTLVYSIYLLAKEKELFRESRDRDKDNLTFRTNCLVSANKQGAGDLVVMLLLSSFVAVFFYGFAPAEWSTIFLGWLVGLLVLGIALLVILEPLSVLFAKLFSRFHFTFNFRKKSLEAPKKKSSEPEEAVFIGIND
jgi:Protein export membrane protein.